VAWYRNCGLKGCSQLFSFFFSASRSTYHLISDSFFASTRKRKKPSFGNQRKTTKSTGSKRTRDPKADDSDDDDQIGAGGIDDMELRGSDVESEEEIQETAAEKRIRLAKGYLDGIKQGLDGRC
jgi:ribosomal RNA-processing protein 9